MSSYSSCLPTPHNLVVHVHLTRSPYIYQPGPYGPTVGMRGLMSMPRRLQLCRVRRVLVLGCRRHHLVRLRRCLARRRTFHLTGHSATKCFFNLHAHNHHHGGYFSRPRNAIGRPFTALNLVFGPPRPTDTPCTSWASIALRGTEFNRTL